MSPEIAPGVSFLAIRGYMKDRHKRKIQHAELKIDQQRMMRERIMAVVGSHLNIPVEDIRGKTQKREPTEARQIAMHLILKHTTMNKTAIGVYFDRNHSTVVTSIQLIDGFLEVNPVFRERYNNIEKEI